MGQQNQFRCESCGYEAIVSGGDDFGMRASTTTIVCETCEELYDVTTAEFPPYPHQSDFELGEPLCPKNREHPIRRWPYLGPCPRCGRQMVLGEVTINWD